MAKKVLDIVTRYDTSIAKLEAAEVARLNASLSASFTRLERDLRTQYPRLQSQGSLTVLQRKLLLSEQLKDTLTLLPENNNEAVRFQNTLQTASESGGRLADELVVAREAKYPLKEFSEIPIEAVAAQARDGVNRLYRYSEDFRVNASSVIEQGLIQGWGASKVGRALREQLGVTKSKAETLARTEILSALNTAATERYEANGIKYVQVFSTPSTRLCPICAARNGNVYPIGQIKIPQHPRCRCLQIAWSDKWQKLGLTGDKFTLDYHNKGIAELAKQGLKPNYSGVSAFERYDKRLKPPTPTWKPGEAPVKVVEKIPKVVKPKKEKTVANAPVSSQDFINLGRKQNAKYLEELATFPEQEANYFNRFKTACDEFGKDRKNDAKKSAFEQKRNEYTEFQNSKIARLSDVFSDWRQSLLAKGDAKLASKWAATIDIDKSVEVARDANVIRKELEEYHRLTRGKVSGSLSRVFLDTDRAYAMTDDKLVNIGIQAYKIPGTDRFQVNQVQSKQTLFHEVSHLVEDSTPRYKQAANEWLRNRATSQTPEKLRVLTGVKSYRDFEVALPDDFIDEYVGKVYPDGATEVLSMGMEHFASAESMQSLYLKDKDMFELMLGILEDG